VQPAPCSASIGSRCRPCVAATSTTCGCNNKSLRTIETDVLRVVPLARHFGR
jgi:hypothetical protein